MADLDEEIIHQSTASSAQDPSAHPDHDISDETQDFRLLNSLSLLSDPAIQVLPRRGEKDFEPNPTQLQADTLAASRLAMHNAIAYPRLHYPKTQIVGIYCPDGELAPPPRAATPSEDETHPGTKHRRAWKKTWKLGAGGDTCVCVPNAKGQTFKTMGKADSFNRMWLLPEEALYLLERGSLDIRWRAAPQTTSSGSDKSDAGSTNAEAGIPMSLQAAYACFLGRGGLTLERYTVFSGLRRGGYVVLRAPTWDESAEPAGSTSASDGESVVAPLPASSAVAGLFSRLFAWIYRGGTSYTADTIRGPVVGLGLHRSYSDIYRALSIIPYHDPTFSDPSPPPPTTPPYRLAFHVYKPSTPYRKTSPGPPDFRLAVISARTNPTIPTLESISALLVNTPLCPPKGEKMDRMMYMRLRHGYRHVILAVVDQGVASFLRIADAGFGMEKLYAIPAPSGGGKLGRRPPPRKNSRR